MVALVLLVLALVVDLLRSDSLLVRTWHRLTPTATPIERALDNLERTRLRR